MVRPSTGGDPVGSGVSTSKELSSFMMFHGRRAAWSLLCSRQRDSERSVSPGVQDFKVLNCTIQQDKRTVALVVLTLVHQTLVAHSRPEPTYWSAFGKWEIICGLEIIKNVDVEATHPLFAAAAARRHTIFR